MLGRSLQTILLLAVGFAQGSRAQEPNQNVSITILTVLASSKHNQINKALAPLADAIMEKDKTITGIKLHHTESASLKLGEKKLFKLTDGSEAEVTVHEKTDKDGCVILSVQAPKMEKVTYKCVCGKYVSLVTDVYVGKDMDRLILAVMGKPCTLKK